MLFRRRVSFRGALNLRRRVYDEMAAHNAPATAQYEAQRLQQSNAPSFTTPRRLVNHALQSAFPAQTSPPPVDCRWKRGRPVTFSIRAFSTKSANHTAETSDVVGAPATPGGAVQAHNHDVGQPHALTTHANLDSAVNSSDPKQGDQQGAPPILAHSTAPSTSGNHAMEDVSDNDHLLTSSDESETESDPDGCDVEEAGEDLSETHTPLEFQIPEDVLRAAMTAPKNTKASFWSSTLYRGPEDVPVLVHYCKTKEVAERVAKHFVNEPVIGFDIEWKPYSSPASIKKNVSLIQLACEDRVALFHIALFQGSTAAQLMPPTLKAILESPDNYKVGVAIKGDFSRVSKFLKVQPQGVYELSRLYNLVEHYATNPSKVNNKLVALAPQVQQHLQLPLYKGGHLTDNPEDLDNVRSSDWSMPLNRQQIHYAAADAYAGFRLFDVLEEKRKLLKPTPLRPLVCDYDSKPKPRSTVSKPRKKRSSSVKDEEATIAVEEKPVAAAERTSEPEEEEAREKPEQSQDTEGYETAQEDFLDSHQLEGEEPTSAEDSYESTEESDDDTASDPELSLRNEEVTPAAEVSQRRVGRINLSQLRGPDPGYPKLPSLHGGGEVTSTSDEDLIDLSDRLNEVKLDRKDKAPDVLEEEEATDEFEDSELEETLQDLSINSDGELRGVPPDIAPKATASERQDSAADDGTETKKMEPFDETGSKAGPAVTTHDLTTDKEEQRLSDLINDREVVEHLHDRPTSAPAPAANVAALQFRPFEPSAPPPAAQTEPPSESTHTPEYTLATAWARSHLSSTIPSPGSLTPSHIRATIPHLRAYHMWYYQHLPLDKIARQVRDPPLAASTVASYVLQAITLERMEYDASAVRGLLMGMPEALRRGKWRGLAEKVGAR